MNEPATVLDQAMRDSRKEVYGDKYLSILMEQYKLYVETTNKVSDRRGTTQTFLLTANTLLLAVYSLVAGKDVPIRAAPALWQLLIPLAGLLVAITWYALIRSYRQLNAAKFRVIHDMEKELPIQSFQMEWDYLFTAGSTRHVVLSRAEQTIPLTFACIYGVLGINALF